MKCFGKRGQFFLIAALVIVVIVVGLVAVINTVNVNAEDEQFFDLSKEIKFETKQVLDYGVYNKQETLVLTQGFLEEYADYIAKEQVVFVFGNKDDLDALFFERDVTGTIGISTGDISTTSVQIEDIIGREADVVESGGKVMVEISGIEYEFNLKEGQNFFFVIVKHEDEEKFVAQG